MKRGCDKDRMLFTLFCSARFGVACFGSFFLSAGFSQFFRRADRTGRRSETGSLRV